MWNKYKRTAIAEMRPYLKDEVLDEVVSISKADRDNGSPRVGDMICRNQEMHEDQWLVAEEYFKNNFEKTKDEITFQITVTDNNDWEGEDFSFVINDVTEEYYNTLLHRSKKHENLSVAKTEFTKENVELVNKTSNNTYMDRFYILDFIPDLSKCDNIYEDLFYKGVGVV